MGKRLMYRCCLLIASLLLSTIICGRGETRCSPSASASSQSAQGQHATGDELHLSVALWL